MIKSVQLSVDFNIVVFNRYTILRTGARLFNGLVLKTQMLLRISKTNLKTNRAAMVNRQELQGSL